MGKPLMPWQRHVADVALEIDTDGRFVYNLVLVTVPRQSGKTTLFGSILDHRAITTSRARCWFTMQTQKDAVDWLINEHWPLLVNFGNACSLRRQAGSENIKWAKSGGLVRPFPPNPTGLHGKISDLVVIDECWAFDFVRGQQLDQAIVPTQATRANAQVWKVSTAGDATSLWWLGTVEAGRAAVRAGRTSGIAYFEWGCPEELDPTEPDSWPIFHPALGHTIGPSSIQSALDMLGPDEFARAYGNRWVSSTQRVIPLEAWRNAADRDAPLPEAGNLALGFDAAVDRTDAAIAAAWRDADGIAHIEIADRRDGTGWLAARMAELRDTWQPRRIGFDYAGPALDIADELSRNGIEAEPLKTKEYVAACASFLELLITEPPAIRIRPNVELDAAAGSAAMRTLGDAWAWSRRQSSVSISTLTAATVALWTWDHAPADAGTFRIY